MPSKAKDYYQRNKDDVQAAAGVGMIADGLMGLEMPGRGDRRPGIGKALVAVMFGLVFVGVGLVILTVVSAPSGWVETRGTVTDVRYRDGSCAPVADYVVEGTTYTVLSSTYSNPCRASIGQDISVSYDPTSPASAQIDSGFLEWMPWIFVGVGALIAISGIVTVVVRAATLGAGVALLVKSRRRKQRDTGPPPLP